jgi:hypothetical protein
MKFQSFCAEQEMSHSFEQSSAVVKAKKVETSTTGGVDKKKKDDNNKTVPLSLKGNKSCSLFLPLQPGTKREIQSEGG